MANNVLRDDDRRAEMTDWPPSQGMRQPEEGLERIHPDNRDRVRREFAAVVTANADEFGTTHRIMRPNVEQRWVAPQGVVLRKAWYSAMRRGKPSAPWELRRRAAAQQAELALR